MLEIDGSYGAGGGQILRTALTLAAVTQTPIRVRRIRAERSNPGLSPQHLTAVQALAELCRAEAEGTTLGSTSIVFRPRESPAAGEYEFDMADAAEGGSAGSVMLLFQALLYPLLLADGPSQLVLRGGTHVKWSPTVDYIQNIFVPLVRRMGIDIDLHLTTWGFYPNGGGEIGIDIRPASALNPVTVTARGSVDHVTGRAVASNLPSHIPQRMVNRARSFLEARGFATDLTAQRVTGPGPGAGIFLTAVYEESRAGFSALGKPGKPSEAVAEEACTALLTNHATGAPVDKYLADQLLLPAALADGHSSYRTAEVTDHLVTNRHIIHQFISAKMTIDAEPGQPGTVEVDGAGIRS